MMMTNSLQHPVISAVERWGYPKPQSVAHQCSECGEPIYEGESAYHFGFGWICEICVRRAHEVVDDG